MNMDIYMGFILGWSSATLFITALMMFWKRGD